MIKTKCQSIMPYICHRNPAAFWGPGMMLLQRYLVFLMRSTRVSKTQEWQSTLHSTDILQHLSRPVWATIFRNHRRCSTFSKLHSPQVDPCTPVTPVLSRIHVPLKSSPDGARGYQFYYAYNVPSCKQEQWCWPNHSTKLEIDSSQALMNYINAMHSHSWPNWTGAKLYWVCSCCAGPVQLNYAKFHWIYIKHCASQEYSGTRDKCQAHDAYSKHNAMQFRQCL